MAISRWKVTTKDRRSLYVEDPQFRLTYYKGVLIIPPSSAPGIFVFDTKDSAERFAEHELKAVKILRVLPIGRAIKLRGFRPAIFDNHTIYRFWKNLPETIKASKGNGSLAKHLGNPLLSIEYLDGTLIYPAVKVMD
jgi:hypothetical protein